MTGVTDAYDDELMVLGFILLHTGRQLGIILQP